MNNAADLLRWFQQRCLSLLVHQANQQSVPTCMNKPVNMQKQAVRFYVCAVLTYKVLTVVLC